ncbi:MAG: RCC1 domain-containing protein [Candidatus Brachytrichaceae bacterium NZ_4S206]|jgi:alpha-tubulin suppressor-like RCC1 family protein
MRHPFKKATLWMRALAVASLLPLNFQIVGASAASNAPVSALTAGEKHTCAIRAGTLLCWGENSFGQLGLGDQSHRAAPQAVTTWPAAASGAVTAVSAGRSYTCAVRNGALFCWGANEYGQLGLGESAAAESRFGTPPLEPRAVTLPGRGAVTSVATGWRHTCAVRGGALYCWGYNAEGQLGLGDAAQSSFEMSEFEARPVTLPGSGAVTAVVAGRAHTCAIRGGALYCWGENRYGQLGLDDEANQTAPKAVALPGRGTVTAVAAGESHTCAVRGGALYCWGEDEFGQLGSGEQVEGTAFRVVKLPGSGAVTSLIAGRSHTCAARGASLYCWGENFYGQLGLGDTNWHEGVKAIALPGSEAVTAAAGGDSHTCAARGNALYCWGRNDRGQLGIESTTRYTTPQATSLPGEGSVTALAVSAEGHTCAVRGGALYCWGLNDYGQTGSGDDVTYDAPQEVAFSGRGEIGAIAAGLLHTCAARGDGLFCWGRNAFGELAQPEPGSIAFFDRPQAVNLADGGRIGAVSTGWFHTCAIRGGGLLCWGRNDAGQLGLGNRTDYATPQAIQLPGSGIVNAVSAGGLHTCAIRGGALYCWGRNDYFQLGLGDDADKATPQAVSRWPDRAGEAVTAVASGYYHTCAIRGGGLYCWGASIYGQLGLGETQQAATPQRVTLPGGGVAQSVSTNADHTCAISGGRLFCWGRNDYGQLGLGDFTFQNTPQEVSLPGSGAVTAVGTGSDHTCAIRGGALYCWGRNDFGQIGLARPLTPQQVKLP